MIPALVPPGYLVLKAWDTLSAQGLHPVFKLLACAAIVAAILYAVVLMYRYLPMFLSIGLTVAYMAAVYWIAASMFTHDPVWIAATAAVAGILGFFGARAIAREEYQAPA
jgi:hypothetical protein